MVVVKIVELGKIKPTKIGKVQECKAIKLDTQENIKMSVFLKDKQNVEHFFPYIPGTDIEIDLRKNDDWKDSHGNMHINNYSGFLTSSRVLSVPSVDMNLIKPLGGTQIKTMDLPHPEVKVVPEKKPDWDAKDRRIARESVLDTAFAIVKLAHKDDDEIKKAPDTLADIVIRVANTLVNDYVYQKEPDVTAEDIGFPEQDRSIE